MNKAAPWSIKGVDFDARDAAREAAQREGMTLGEWLNDVISERAAESGESPDDFGEDDRLNAVAARLARMRDGGARVRRRDDRRRDEARDRDDEFDFQRRRVGGRARSHSSMSRNARSREVSWREQQDAEALLESAIDAFERRTNRGHDRTARALSDVAELLEHSQSSRARENDTLKSIARRLREIEDHVARDPDDDAGRPVRGALSRMESRVDALSHGRDEAGLRDIDAKLSEIAEHLHRGPEARGRAGDGDRLARIEGQIAALSQQLDKATQRPTLREIAAEGALAPRRAPDAVSQIVQRQRELDGAAAYPFARRAEPRPPFDMRRGSSELETRLTSIVERLENRLSPEAQAEQAAPQNLLLAGLQGDISRMSEHIEKMRADMARRPAPQPSAPSAFPTEPIDQLRREISAVSRGLGELAPRASVSALEHAVRDIADRLDIARRDPSAAQFDQLARELRENLRDIDPRGAIAALEQDMRAVAAKIENLEARGGADPQTIRAIFEQTREVRDLLSRASAASQNGERAQRELVALADRLETTGEAGAVVAPGEFARILDDIRAVVAEGAGASGLRALEQRVESLSERIDAALQSGSGAQQIADFGERLDKLHRAVAQTLSAPRHAPAVDTRQLEQLVRDLGEKVDRAAEPGASRDDLAALHTQIELLSRKIERSSGRDDAVAGLERMISDLFGQLNETRASAFEAAETAARNAARDTVREAMSGAGAMAGQGELGREIANLRSIQSDSDQRTHATLKAVHETLERVVDRLATLEVDVIDSRAVAPRGRDAAEPVVTASPAPPKVAAPKAAAPKAAAIPAKGATISAAAALARLKGGGSEIARPGAPAVESARRAEAAPSLDDHILIEPGAGRSAGEPEDRSAQAGFIAAARRAALAAQAATAAADEAEAIDIAEKAQGGGRLAQARAVYERRRKPILLSLAALVGLLGALQIASVYLGRSGPIEPPPAVTRPAAPAPAKSPAADAGKAASPAKPRDEAAATKAKGAEDSANPGPKAEIPTAPAPRRVDGPASPLPTLARQPRADIGKIDPTPVGAIAPSPAPVVALATLETLSTHGDAAAQYTLAARYADGDQAPRDLKLAARWFEKSAAQGLAPAQYRLGVLYERGLGVPRDTARATTWYRRAADRGNIRAMHNLAVLLADGGGKPDYAAAAKWFRRAAEHGVRDSQYNLAILYARGMGGPQDLVQSYLWFSAAAAQGDEDAGRKRDEVASRLDAKALARAKALAAAFRPIPPNTAANGVAPPPGGWRAPAPAKADGKAKSRAKMTQL